MMKASVQNVFVDPSATLCGLRGRRIGGGWKSDVLAQQRDGDRTELVVKSLHSL